MTSSDDTLLLWFSYAFMAVIGSLLVIPILQRKSDVFTAWNFFLVGAFVFGGLSGINCVNHEHYRPNYRSSDYYQYYAGTIVFYTTIVCTYYFLKFPRKLAGRTFLKWPALSGTTMPFIILPMAGLAVIHVVPVPIPLVGQLLFQAALCAPIIALACAFVAWYRSPTNVALFGLLVVVAGLALFGSIASGTSRRYLICTFAAAPVALYWVWLRYKATPVIFGWIAALIAAAIPLLMGYTLVRHAPKGEAETATQRVQMLLATLPDAVKSGGSLEGFMGQDSVEAALLTIHLLNDGSGDLERYPFFALFYVVANPIPRSVWPDKPRSLGVDLVHASGMASQGLNFNIGVNVVGQCFYDGGLHIHVIYAVLFGAFLRFFDELMIRQPGNPYLIGTLVAMSGQILGWPRGCIDVFGLQIIMAFALMVMIAYVGRVVLGGGLVYGRTDHIVHFPVLRSPADQQRWGQSLTSVVTPVRRRVLADDEELLPQPALRAGAAPPR